jgi:hypothetical protein
LFVQLSRACKRPHAERHGDEKTVNVKLAIAIHHTGYFCGAAVLNKKVMAVNDPTGRASDEFGSNEEQDEIRCGDYCNAIEKVTLFRRVHVAEPLSTSNENKMSDGGRDRASLGVEV